MKKALKVYMNKNNKCDFNYFIYIYSLLIKNFI